MMSQEYKDNYVPKVCPFCGKVPHVDFNTELVHCETPECAIGDFYIHMEEWNERFDDIKLNENNITRFK